MMKLAERDASRLRSATTPNRGHLGSLHDPGVENPPQNEARTIAAMVQAMPRHAQDRDFELKKNLYPVDGTDQDWHRFANGTVAILVEGARQTRARAQARQGDRERRSRLRFLFRRFTTGRLLDIHVSDGQGHGIDAEVVIHGMEPKVGEVWGTRAPGRTPRLAVERHMDRGGEAPRATIPASRSR